MDFCYNSYLMRLEDIRREREETEQDRRIAEAEELVEEYLALDGDHMILNEIQDAPDYDRDALIMYEKLAYHDDYKQALKTNDTINADEIRFSVAYKTLFGKYWMEF